MQQRSDLHRRYLAAIRGCREFFSNIRDIDRAADTAEYETALKEQQSQNSIPFDLDTVSLRHLTFRAHTHRELMRFPLVDAVIHFHRAALAYANGDPQALGGPKALILMTESITMLIQARVSILLRALFWDFDNDRPVAVAQNNNDKDNNNNQAQQDMTNSNNHNNIILLAGSSLALTLLGASNAYFELRRSDSRLVSDVAPLLMDLAAFEIPLAELLNAAWNSSSISSGDFAFDPNAVLSRAQALSKHLPVVFDHDDGVMLDARISKRRREWMSGFSGKGAAFVALWRSKEDDVLQRAASDDEDEDDDGTDQQDANNNEHEGAAAASAAKQQQQEVLKRRFTFGAQNLLNSFLNSKGKKHRERVIAARTEAMRQKEIQEEAERQRKLEENMRERKLNVKPAALQSKLLPLLPPRRPRSPPPPPPVARVPFELLVTTFEMLLPSELVNAANVSRGWQRVLLARIQLRRRAQLSVTFTRRVHFFLREEWGKCRTVVPVTTSSAQVVSSAGNGEDDE